MNYMLVSNKLFYSAIKKVNNQLNQPEKSKISMTDLP